MCVWAGIWRAVCGMWIKRKKERRECWFRPYTLILWAWPNRIISPERLVYRSLFIWHGKLNRILCVCVYSLNIKNIHIHYQRLVLNWLIKYKTAAGRPLQCKWGLYYSRVKVFMNSFLMLFALSPSIIRHSLMKRWLSGQRRKAWPSWRISPSGSRWASITPSAS